MAPLENAPGWAAVVTWKRQSPAARRRRRRRVELVRRWLAATDLDRLPHPRSGAFWSRYFRAIGIEPKPRP